MLKLLLSIFFLHCALGDNFVVLDENSVRAFSYTFDIEELPSHTNYNSGVAVYNQLRLRSDPTCQFQPTNVKMSLTNYMHVPLFYRGNVPHMGEQHAVTRDQQDNLHFGIQDVHKVSFKPASTGIEDVNIYDFVIYKDPDFIGPHVGSLKMEVRVFGYYDCANGTDPQPTLRVVPVTGNVEMFTVEKLMPRSNFAPQIIIPEPSSSPNMGLVVDGYGRMGEGSEDYSSFNETIQVNYYSAHLVFKSSTGEAAGAVQYIPWQSSDYRIVVFGLGACVTQRTDWAGYVSTCASTFIWSDEHACWRLLRTNTALFGEAFAPGATRFNDVSSKSPALVYSIRSNTRERQQYHLSN